MPAYLSHAILADTIFSDLKKYHLLKVDVSKSKLRLDSIKPDFFSRSSGKYDYCDENHNYFVQDFVVAQIGYIINNKLYENPAVMSQFYGHILHCIMDQQFHPFIYGRTDNEKTQGLPISGKHFELESLIDSYLAQKYCGDTLHPKDYATFCINPKYILLEHEEKTIINESYRRVYGYPNTSNNSILLSLGLLLEESMIRCDQTALKRKIYEKLKFKYISRNIESPEYISQMNLEHDTWFNPNDPNSLEYKYSVDELFKIVINHSLEILEIINRSIYDNKTISQEFLTAFPDISLDTGVECNYQKKY